jgi:hypothetical protein
MLGQKLWIPVTVREMLLDGYDQPIMKIAHMSSPLLGTKVVGDRMQGFLYRNTSVNSGGVYNVETGSEDMKKLGNVHSWNYVTKTDFLEGECSKITGSLGDLFPTVQSKNETIVMFFPEICKSVKLEFSEETEMGGIPAYRYEFSRSVTDNGTTDPLTHCNCAGQCLPAGVSNDSECYHGSPIFVSYPHFYTADPYYLRQLKGLKPDPNLHVSEIILEPVSVKLAV